MTTVYTIEQPPRVAENTPPPLVLLLHGFGSNEQDLIGLTPYLDPRLHFVSARAIFDVGFGYGWYHLYGVPGNLVSDDATRARSLEVLTEFISDLPERVGADPQRFYLLGFSQGAVMGMNLALTMPRRIAGVAAISGYLDDQVLPQVQPDALAHLNMLVMHGTQDDLIPVEWGRRLKTYLETTPARLAYHEYPIGHGIHPQALPVLSEWFRSQIDQEQPDGS